VASKSSANGFVGDRFCFCCVSLDDNLDAEEQLSEQLESLPYLVRFQYDKSRYAPIQGSFIIVCCKECRLHLLNFEIIWLGELFLSRVGAGLCAPYRGSSTTRAGVCVVLSCVIHQRCNPITLPVPQEQVLSVVCDVVLTASLQGMHTAPSSFFWYEKSRCAAIF
jgi:hypothetical protein